MISRMLLYHYNIISKKAQLHRASYEFDERYLLKRFLNERQESVNDKHQNKMRLVTFWESNIPRSIFRARSLYHSRGKYREFYFNEFSVFSNKHT